MHATLDTMHRDMKPQNIMLQSVDDLTVKLIDFGFAKDFKNKTLTHCCGSPRYMAPEQMKCVPYNEKIDIWAIGLITFELLTYGDFPFSSKIDEL